MGFFALPPLPHQLWCPPNLLSNGYLGALIPGAKQLGDDTDHSPPPSAKVKNVWSYTSIPISLYSVMLN